MSLQEKTNAKTKSVTKTNGAPVTFMGKRSNEILLDLQLYKNQVDAVIGKYISTEKLLGACSAIVAKNPEIAKCTQASFVSAMISTAMLDLDPTPELGQVYFVPFWNKKISGTEVQFIVGYRGLVNLMRRSGQIADIICETIHANDEFKYNLGRTPDIIHIPPDIFSDKERGDIVGAYCVIRFVNGGEQMKVMSKKDILKYKAKSAAATGKFPQFSPWNDKEIGEGEMFKKTVLRNSSKTAPVSIKDATKSAAIDGALLSKNAVDVENKGFNQENVSFDLDPADEVKQIKPEPEKTPPKKETKKKPIVNKETGEVIDASEFETTTLNEPDVNFEEFKTFNDIWIVKTDFFRNTAYMKKRSGFNVGEYIKKNNLTNKDGNEATLFTDLKAEDQVRILFQLSR